MGRTLGTDEYVYEGECVHRPDIAPARQRATLRRCRRCLRATTLATAMRTLLRGNRSEIWTGVQFDPWSQIPPAPAGRPSAAFPPMTARSPPHPLVRCDRPASPVTTAPFTSSVSVTFGLACLIGIRFAPISPNTRPSFVAHAITTSSTPHRRPRGAPHNASSSIATNGRPPTPRRACNSDPHRVDAPITHLGSMTSNTHADL